MHKVKFLSISFKMILLFVCTVACKTIVGTNKLVSTMPHISYVPVARQQGNDCGYHALYNAINRHETLHGNAAPEFPLEQWRKLIIEQRGTINDDGGNLDQQEIEYLARHSRINPATFSIIPNVSQFHYTTDQLSFYPTLLNLPTIIQLLRTKKNSAHAFIVGNMIHSTNSQGVIQGTVGHWRTIVARRNNKNIEYEVMDSLGYTPTDQVKILQGLVEKSDLKKLSLVATKIQTLNAVSDILGKARNSMYIGSGPYAGTIKEYFNSDETLALLKKAIEYITKANMYNNPLFSNSVKQIVTDLNSIKNYDPSTRYTVDSLLEQLENRSYCSRITRFFNSFLSVISSSSCI